MAGIRRGSVPRDVQESPPRPDGKRWLAVVTVAFMLSTGIVSPATAEPVGPSDAAAEQATTSADPPDYCGDQCDQILPPGQNGNATLAELIGHVLIGTKPPHTDDQLAPYNDLASEYQELDTDTIDQFFQDNSFGVADDEVSERYRPRQDVTVVRDEQAGIPHIYGDTRSGTTFGAGYATAEDKLFLMDVLRRAGRGEVSSFAGGAEENRQLEQQFFATAPYTEQELRQQIDRVAQQGARGRQAVSDAKSYVDGINSYLRKAHEQRTFPGEYVATGHVDAVTNEGEIEPFKLTDLVVLASLVGAQFGSGGGGEVENAVARMRLHERFGPERGERVWRTFQAQDDPEATTTVHGDTSFPYARSPENPEGQALPDAGSVAEQQLVFDREGTAREGEPETANPDVSSGGSEDDAENAPAPDETGSSDTDPGDNSAAGSDDPEQALRGVFDDGVVPSGMGEQRGMSNALMVSGKHTESGNPVAVFGPQTSYFAPQLLTLQELNGPGISSRGASFAGLSFYTLLGRGQDYAWSATSAEQDITDTYAVRLCEPDGSAPTRESDHYLFHGQCEPMRTVERDNSWEPSLGDSTGSGSYTLRSYRTAYGPVTHRATVDGKPVAYTTARSTYKHEVDSIIGFQKFNDPNEIRSAQDFQHAASDVNFTFNWFYADADETAHFNSGANVKRPSNVDPSMPITSDPRYEWIDWNPADNTSRQAPFEEHPQSRNQDYYVDWNNKQAAETAAGEPNKGAVQRVDLLDRRVRELVERGDVDRADLTQAMMDAGLTDLRAERVLPTILRVIDSAPIEDQRTAELVRKLRDWLDDGGKRAETEPGSEKYAHAEAIQLLDEWWPRLVRAEFEPQVGQPAYRAMTDVMSVNQSPSGWQNEDPETQNGQSHQGSAFQLGWYGQVSKDLRGVLGDSVEGGFDRPLCGDGDLSQCRAGLLDSLRDAADTPATETYPGDAECAAGDQWCADAIVHQRLGGIGHDPLSWQNRPTYQQVVEFPDRRKDDRDR